MKRGVFITATDTGVGKTFIGTGIARALSAAGIDVGVMKPAESGCSVRGGILVPRDATALMRAAQCDDDLDLVNPYRFRFPLAPSVASSLEGRTINIQKMLSSYRRLEKQHSFMIVEGAGGILVPLTAKSDFLDLAAQLGLPVLIVARPGLGTINHALLTVMAVRRRRLPIAGIVVNHGQHQTAGISVRTNPSVIAKRSRVPIIGIVRHGQKDLTAIAKTVLG